MQTILGSGGAIGIPLAKELRTYTDHVRLVSRNPGKVSVSDELFEADLTNKTLVDAAVSGSQVVYLTAGLKYDSRVWKQFWPKIMLNTIEACKKHNCKLVFLDNVYSYGKVNGWMTEETPYNPISKKGEIRAKIADELKNEYSSGNMNALILRAADFYGPNISSGVFNILVVNKLASHKKANWLGNPDVKHSFSYTLDVAKAAALLGNTDSAYNQVWHGPTNSDVLTGRELITYTAELMKRHSTFTQLKKWHLYIAGLTNRSIFELAEMYYQNDSDYLFDSSKFNKAFNYSPISYNEGIKEILNSL